MKMLVCKKVSFDAAHFLPNYSGKCANMHGHRWIVELAIEGEVKATGMVVDFTLLKEFLEEVKEVFDHKVINDVIENPTAENICVWIRDRLTQWKLDGHIDFLKLFRCELEFIRVWETPDSYAELRL